MINFSITDIFKVVNLLKFISKAQRDTRKSVWYKLRSKQHTLCVCVCGEYICIYVRVCPYMFIPPVNNIFIAQKSHWIEIFHCILNKLQISN